MCMFITGGMGILEIAEISGGEKEHDPGNKQVNADQNNDYREDNDGRVDHDQAEDQVDDPGDHCRPDIYLPLQPVGGDEAVRCHQDGENADDHPGDRDGQVGVKKKNDPGNE